MKTDHAPQTVDAYIARFPEDARETLQRVRAAIREAAPEAEETISYQMPTFKLRGKPLVYFGAFKNHFGLYPTPGGLEPFKDELTPYKNAKGSVQFSLAKPLPYDLISKIVTFKARETLAKAEGER